MTLDELKLRVTLAALRRHGGRVAAVAGELGVTWKTVYNWLARWESEGRVRREGGSWVPGRKEAA